MEVLRYCSKSGPPPLKVHQCLYFQGSLVRNVKDYYFCDNEFVEKSRFSQSVNINIRRINGRTESYVITYDKSAKYFKISSEGDKSGSSKGDNFSPNLRWMFSLESNIRRSDLSDSERLLRPQESK